MEGFGIPFGISLFWECVCGNRGLCCKILTDSNLSKSNSLLSLVLVLSFGCEVPVLEVEVATAETVGTAVAAPNTVVI